MTHAEFPPLTYYATVEDAEFTVEDDSPAVFTLKLHSVNANLYPIPPENPVFIPITFGGSAHMNIDFTVSGDYSAGKVRFEGDTAYIYCYALPDGIVEGVETIEIELNYGYTPPHIENGETEIYDLSFYYGTLSVVAPAIEGQQNGKCELTLHQLPGGAAVPASADTFFQVRIGGTATPVTDYTPVIGGTVQHYYFSGDLLVRIPAGSLSTTFEFSAVDEGVFENCEEITASVNAWNGQHWFSSASVAVIDTTRLLPGTLTESQFTFKLLAGCGPNDWTVEKSDDLVHWSVFANYLPEENEEITITDNNIAGVTARFYRAKNSLSYCPISVGFYWITVPGRIDQNTGGYALVAPNQLYRLGASTVSTLLPSVPNQTKLLKMNGNGTFTENTFSAGAWSTPSMPIQSSEGVFIRSPSTDPLKIPVAGYVREGQLVSGVSQTPYGLIAAQVPKESDLVWLEFRANEEDSVNTWNEASQGYGQNFSYLNQGWYDSTYKPNIPTVGIGKALLLNRSTTSIWRQQFSVWSQELQATGVNGDEVSLKVVGGKRGQAVNIFWSSDLNTWTQLPSVTIGNNETVSFTHTLAGITPRFYRASNSLGRAYSSAGFYRATLPARNPDGTGGLALLGNHLLHPVDNSVPQLFAGLPAQSIVKHLNADGTFLDNTFNGLSWSIPSMTTLPGQGVLVRNGSQSPHTIHFFGTLPEGKLSHAVPTGYCFRSSVVPEPSDMITIQYPAVDFEFVYGWDEGNQQYSQAIDYSGGIWYNGAFEPDPGNFPLGKAFLLQSLTDKNWVRSFSVWGK